jgi:hypothetical protein
MMKREWIGGIYLTFLIVVLFFPTAAVSQSNVIINVQASGSGTFTETFVTNIDWDDVYADPLNRKTWNLPEAYTFDFGGGHTATIESLSVAVKADPKVELGFSAISANGDTDFLFTSDVLNFDPLTDVTANVYASASCLKGTTISAVDFPDKLCRALYNDTEIFADVMDPFSFPGGLPAYVEEEIAGEVSSMQLMWSLNVNSGGHATGLSEFEITGTAIPEPATILLLGLGGLALIRKRKT